MILPALSDGVAVRHPAVVAHRGNAAEFPENTLPALRSALELGVSYVEFDVQLSNDHVPVVIHDADLKRTGIAAHRVFDLPAAELVTMPVHEPARFGARYAGTCIPLLSEVVELIRGSVGVTAFVEVKRASIAQHGLERTLDAVLRAAAPIRERTLIISFSAEAVGRAQSKGWRTGAVLDNYDQAGRQRIEELRPEFVFCNHRKLPPDDSALWPGSWQWVLYEIGTPELALQLQARGAHLFETMQVAELCKAFRKS